MNSIDALHDHLRSIDSIDEYSDEVFAEEFAYLCSNEDNRQVEQEHGIIGLEKLSYEDIDINEVEEKEEKILDNLIDKIKNVNKTRRAVYEKNNRLTVQLKQIQRNRAAWEHLQNNAFRQAIEYQDALSSYRSMLMYKHRQLESLMQINVLNDCFYIWKDSSYATINNFRLGKNQSHHPGPPVDWGEINIALGLAAYLLEVLRKRIGFRYRFYTIKCMGSCTKIEKQRENSKAITTYKLYYDVDGFFTLTPDRNFNDGILAFVMCVDILSQEMTNKDASLSLPYTIDPKAGTINNVHPISLRYQRGEEERWTRALKYLMTDIKWLVQYSAKFICANS